MLVEADNVARLPFLEKGILQILSNATGGLSIVLEHRYYGDSVPVKSLSTDDLRFLNNDEAMEDSAHVSLREIVIEFVPRLTRLTVHRTLPAAQGDPEPGR